ncbi:MAG: hypothetical protein KIH63_000380 [Candidatus Saccharibacteria bacterium]|nr:hypothetical protein [Candidatus Saccharibacteria bacterium]
MKIANVVKGFAALVVSLSGGAIDNEEQVPLWAAVIVSIIGAALVVLLAIAGWAWLGL